MSVLRDRRILIAFWVHLGLTAVGAVVCAQFSIIAAIVCAVCSIAALCVHLAVQTAQAKETAALCDEIDRILRGADVLSLDRFQEGELGILASEIRKLTVRLREQNAALAAEKRFLKESLEDISHQLRTPLTSMILIITMLRDPNQSKQQQQESVQELLTLTTRMQWLIETLLNLSRLEAGAVTFREETTPCREIIRQAVEPFSISLELKGIALETVLCGEPLYTGDSNYCTEAIANIIKNCMEHTPEGGCIRISAEENGIYTQIVIADSGKGIEEKDLPHIFERFYRGSDFAKNGYGIGLSFAQRIITMQDGTIAVRNAKPHGAEFEIRFYKQVV